MNNGYDYEIILSICRFITLLCLIVVYIKWEIDNYNNTFGKWNKEIKEALKKLSKSKKD